MTNPKITGIIVCVDFYDYLKETLPFSKPLLDDLYIITADDDTKTQELCKETNTKFLSIPRTEPFLKGVYINHAFDNIPHENWFLITDSDIVLPPKTIFNVSEIEKRKECLYGAHCQYCDSHKEWVDYRDNGTIYNWKIWTSHMSLTMGALQLFHTNHFKERNNCRYEPCTYIDFPGFRRKGSDFIFSKTFLCRKELLSFFNVIHIADDRNTRKIHNYDGRKTKLFGEI
jgi:hypothetical protein